MTLNFQSLFFLCGLGFVLLVVLAVKLWNAHGGILYRWRRNRDLMKVCRPATERDFRRAGR